jgi:transposase
VFWICSGDEWGLDWVGTGEGCVTDYQDRDIRRFASARQLVGYLGLDPRVRQSGTQPARHGRISKEGASDVRHVLRGRLPPPRRP